MTKSTQASACIKRTIDILGACSGLILFAPVMALIALMIRIKSGSPILYREHRIGLNQIPFELYKFRSMHISNTKLDATVASGDDIRLLPFGAFLRKTHLDELPQLWLVLTGKMSLIGPRPYKKSHFERLPETSQRMIVSVKPGLTGLDALMFIAEDEALKNLDNPESMYLEYFLPEKAKCQIKAIQEQSLQSDLSILTQTFLAIFGKQAKARSIRFLQNLFKNKVK